MRRSRDEIDEQAAEATNQRIGRIMRVVGYFALGAIALILVVGFGDRVAHGGPFLP